MADEQRNWDATDVRQHLAAGDVTAVEVVEAAIARGDAAAALGALVTATPEIAGEAARSATGPLAGVPTAVKDLSDQAGVVTGNGSRAWQDWVAPETAASVQQFLDTGVASIGKSGASEFGLSPSGNTVHLDPVRNPWDLSRSPGGSSAGAAALVAAGVVPIAHAADGGGSIRLPASCCGLVGLKPSFRRLALSADMDRVPIPLVTDGVVTRSVRDTALFHAAVEQATPAVGMPRIGHVTGPSTRRLRVAVVRDGAQGRIVHPDVVRVVDEVAGLLDDLGHEVVDLPMPFTDDVGDDFVLYWGLLAQGLILTGMQTFGRSFDVEQYAPFTRQLASHARRNLHRTAPAILRLRRFGSRHAELHADWDVVVTGTLAVPPPPVDWLSVELAFEEHLDRLFTAMPYTIAQNLSGFPAISLPLGRTSGEVADTPADLPVGVMFGAALGDERTLLELAYELEDARPWPHLAPPPD